jgi:hypothetical protein
MTFVPIGERGVAESMKASRQSRGFVMRHADLTARELDTLAWKFLGSEFTGRIYASWPLDRRVEAYLLHHGLMGLANDGSSYNALLERVMANIGRALRRGLLAPPHT